MRLHGIHYDIGTGTLEGGSTRSTLTLAQIERELADIATGLHANAVRVTGGDTGRIELASRVAARHGLEVWITPMIPNADQTITLARIAESARIAEDLRRAGKPSVLLVGCELSAFMSGILPGRTHGERLALLGDPSRLQAEVTAKGLDPQAAFDAFLKQAVEIARAIFQGRLGYGSGMWEQVDWSIFDFVGVDAYRDAANRAAYPETLRSLGRFKRPVVITEFGCATYRGAADRGGMGWDALQRNATPRRLKRGIQRDEPEQARELRELLAAAEAGGAEGAFIYTYVAPSYPGNPDPDLDLDTASYALVRSRPDGSTEPKAAYTAVAEVFGSR